MKFLLFLIVFALSAPNDLVHSSNAYDNGIYEALLTEKDIHNSLGDYKNIAVIDKSLTPVNPYIIRMLSLSTLLCLTTTLTPDSNVLIIYDTYTASFQFFEISDPLSPYIISTINLDASSSGRAIATSSDGETIFLTMNCGDYEGQLLIVDFSSDTASLTVLSVFSIPYDARSIALSPDDKTLFVGASGDNSAVITIIDVSNPKSPINISSILNYDDPSVWPTLPGGFIVEIAISPDGNYLFITDTCNWHILNISNLDSPSYLNTTIGDCTDGAIDVTIAPEGDNAFILTSNSDLNSSSLQIIDLSTLQIVQTVKVGPFIQYYYDALLSASPDNQNVLITGSENLIVVNVSDINNPNSYTIDTILNPNRIIIAQDSQTAFMTTSENQVAILGLYFDPQLSTQNKILSSISANISSSLLSSMAISSDSKTVLMQYSSYLEIIDVTYRSSPNSLSIYNITNSISDCYSITISPDDKTIFIMCNSEILILDISSLTQPILLTTFPAEPTPGSPFVVSSNGQVGFFSIGSGLQIINISDLTFPTNLYTYDFSDDFTPISLTLAQNDQVAFMLGSTSEGIKEYQVMNLEELTSPDLIVTSEIDAYGDACSIAASLEEQLAIVVTCTGNTSSFIVFDTVFLDAADEIGSFNWAFNISQPIIFSKYSSLIYILTSTQLLIAKITTMKPLNFLRAYPVEDAISMRLSNDELTAFLGLRNGTLVIVDLMAPYALYMVKSNIMLGEVYSNNVIPLIQESTIGLNPINESYAFIQASLISVSIPSNSSQAITSYQALPTWINFDQNYGVLTFAPDAPSHLGSYQLYIAISTLIPTDAFVGIGPIANETESLQLVVSLMSLGYINTKRFLTSDFNPTGELFLTSEYSLYGPEIQTKLSQYYIAMTKSVSVISSLSSNQITSVAINSSLSSTYSQRFVVSALSHSTISLKMTLDTMGDGKIQFVNSDYPAMTSLSEDQSTITLEGFLSDVNNALSQLIINLNDTNDSDCYADFDANDGINLSDDDMIFFVTSFFIINEAPVINPNFSIQAEIDQIPIIMGGQFIIDISNMFTDPNGLELEYSLSMQDSTQYVPQWLMLRGQTIIGSPPEQLSSLQMSLVITAQKQFKSVSQVFTINVEMSLGYTLRQIATLIGPTVTLIGLWIYIRKIYNVCCKRRYKYPKEFVIKVGDKEGVQGVCGITFIKEEARISKLVFEEMRGFIARESRSKSISKKEFIAYFINPQSRQLEEPKLERTIKYGISRVDDNNIYLRKEVIKQLILNEIAKQQLNFKEESLTKQLFNTIKDDWMNLIEMTNDTLLFELNSDKLEKKLESVGITSYHSRKDRELEILADDPNKLTSPFLSMHTSKKVRDSSKLESDLQPASRHSDNFSRKGSDKRKDFSLKETDINFRLLEMVINAHAFKYHSQKVNPIDIKVRINEKIKSTSIFRKVKEFFKLDLSRAKFFGKGEAGHGLNYKVQNNIWRLFGIPEETLKNKTIVIQITNKRGRILRELLIKCLPADHEEQ